LPIWSKVIASVNRKLKTALLDALHAARDPERGRQQQAYMKSTMPNFGITAPELRRICQSLYRQYPLPTQPVWEATILNLFRGASHREERHAAIELLSFKAYRHYISPDLVPLLEEIIVTGAWWDYVDHIAVNLFGPLLAAYPEDLTPLLRSWSRDEDIWRRRTAILAQLKFKDRTDTDLLFELIEPSLQDTEFFLRKAIGWALRELSKTDADSVVDYVALNSDRLSGLSKREALRILIKRGVLG
jgi:3-methyladenine DNA glycosylase AlkD